MDGRRQRLYELKAQVLGAVSHPLRLAIVDCLAERRRCVCEIAEWVGAQRSNVSRHLAVLLGAGIVSCRKEGLNVIYSLRTPCLVQYLSCVTDVLRERLAEETAALAARTPDEGNDRPGGADTQ